ncbi:MAG TPA: isoprenylcysteine carboxylmethyltransferase family protein [Steroidobacteraceae bacterium]|nr:isoprenylcysteine carboxylmethyltransferase family protein [Steroidobacteraceae bacterium]
MRLAHSLVLWLWVAFFICWLILAQFNKKASPGAPWRMAAGVRLAVLLVAVLLVLTSRRQASGLWASIGVVLSMHAGVAGQWVGLALCLAGFGFAIWARMHLGRNWGMPMSLRQGHELVTSGPYAYVRHPIYTGILLAMIGSTLARGLAWLLPLFLGFVYFLFSARTEEKMMVAQFPEAYPAYRQRTRMLIPFLL